MIKGKHKNKKLKERKNDMKLVFNYIKQSEETSLVTSGLFHGVWVSVPYL